MNFKIDFLTHAMSLVVAGIIYLLLTFPTQIAIGGTPYSISGWEMKIIAAIVLELIVGITGIYLFKKLLDTAEILSIETQKFTFQYLAGGFFFASLAAIVLIFGQIVMLYTKESFSNIIIIGSFYPLSLFTASLAVGIAAYYYFAFSYLISKKRLVPILNRVILNASILALIIISLHPYSWFGMVNPPGTLYLRTLVHFILLVIYAPVLSFTLYELATKIRAITDVILAKRYKIIFYGFIAMLGFFVFSAIDALYGELYTIWIYLAYIAAAVSFILLFIGTTATRIG